MATGQHNILGISSRRSACDKCRSSKARCLRKHRDQTQCDRCSRTHSDCVTSPVFRLRSWQPPTASDDDVIDVLQDGTLPHKRRRRSIQRLETLTISESSLDLDLDLLSASREQSLADSAGSYEGLGWVEPSSPSNLPEIPYGEGLEKQINTTFGFIENSLEMNMIEDFFATVPSAPPRPDPKAALPLLHPPNTESIHGATAEFNLDCSPQTLDDDAFESNDRAVVHPEQTLTQRLSKLDYELITVLSQLNQESENEATRTFVKVGVDSTFPSVMDNVLNRTTEFVNVLKLLADTYLPSPSAATAHGRHHSIHEPHTTRRSSFSSSDSEDDRSVDSPIEYLGSPNKQLITTSNSKTNQELDVSSLLPLLLIYIHLLRLYLMIFSHLYEYLKELSESESPQLRPFSGFISSLSIQSGNLQILIFIQMVINHFERIDALLHLPEEFRISNRRGSQRGLLNTPYFQDLTRSILKEEDNGRPQNGKGGIKALRNYIVKVKRLLQKHITP